MPIHRETPSGTRSPGNAARPPWPEPPKAVTEAMRAAAASWLLRYWSNRGTPYSIDGRIVARGDRAACHCIMAELMTLGPLAPTIFGRMIHDLAPEERVAFIAAMEQQSPSPHHPIELERVHLMQLAELELRARLAASRG